MRIKNLHRATDHRAIVLEEVATSPEAPTSREILKRCIAHDFTKEALRRMVSRLRQDGLIGLNDTRGHFITKAGLDYLTYARFDKALPTPHIKPNLKSRRLTRSV